LAVEFSCSWTISPRPDLLSVIFLGGKESKPAAWLRLA